MCVIARGSAEVRKSLLSGFVFHSSEEAQNGQVRADKCLSFDPAKMMGPFRRVGGSSWYGRRIEA